MAKVITDAQQLKVIGVPKSFFTQKHNKHRIKEFIKTVLFALKIEAISFEFYNKIRKAYGYLPCLKEKKEN